MKKEKIRKLMMAAAVMACIVNGGAYASSPKAESIVTNDRITLGDVFDGVTENASYYLAPAPAAGRVTTLNAQDLARISDAFHLGWTADGLVRQTVIRRAAGDHIDRYDIETAVRQKLTENGRGLKFETVLSDPSIRFSIPSGGDRAISVESFAYDPARGTFQAVVSAAAAPELKKEVKGRVYQLVSIPVLRDPLRAGDVISAHDIEHIDMRMDNLSSSMIIDEKKLIGLTPRRGISAMKPLVAGDVQMPVVIKKGDLVTMVLKNGVISLTTQGRALDNGAEGEQIQVMNATSKQIISAVVTGPQNVTVAPPSGAVTANTL